MSESLQWDSPLKYRRGGRTFLGGIDIYYDFNWRKVVGHNRSQFRNGQALAQLARARCPKEKRPALLLTARTDTPERPITADERFYLVVNLPRYLARATGNAAVSYYAEELSREIAAFEELEELASRADVVDAVLSVERIAEWATADPARLQQLRGRLAAADSERVADLPSLVGAFEALEALELEADAVAAIAALFGPGVEREQRAALLRAVTDDTTGRYIAGEVLVERMADRIADAREARAEYQALLDDDSVGETRMQEFIAANLWLLGLEYARLVPQQRLLTGTMDFVLERHDGFQDLLELKDPRDQIVTLTGDYPGPAAPPPSAYALSQDLAQALAQVHSYRDRLTRHADATEDLLGLSASRDPWIIIVIGRGDRLPEHSRRVLTEVNKSLHRVEVVPYDVLAKRADAVLDNIEKYLLTPPPIAPEGG